MREPLKRTRKPRKRPTVTDDYGNALELRRCWTCNTWQTPDQFDGALSRRCATCWATVKAASVCKYCGEYAGLTEGRKPRVVCDKPACEQKAYEAWHEGHRRSLARLQERIRNRKTKRCPSCETRKPLTIEHWSIGARDPDTGEITRYDVYCRPCKYALMRDQYHSDPRHREYMIAKAARQRAAENKRRATDPEYDRRIRERYANWQRRRRLELTEPAEAGRRNQDNEGCFLPVWPLYLRLVVPRLEAQLRLAIGAVARDQTRRLTAMPDMTDPAAVKDAIDVSAKLGFPVVGPVATELGLSDRTLNAWIRGERTSVQSTTVDEILTRTDLFWWDVVGPGEEGFEEYRAEFEGDDERQAAA